MPTYLAERFETSNVRIRHYGYLRSRIASKDKSRRNIELLEIEARENPSPFNDYNLGSEFLALNEPPARASTSTRRGTSLRLEQRWQGAGYAPMLMARVVTARRGAGDFDAARAAIAEGLEIYPDHTDLVLEQALCAQAEGDLRGAAELARRCMEMGDAPTRYAATVGSGTFLAMTVLAEVERSQGRPDVAEKLYRRSLADHPEYAAPVLPLITLMLERGAGAAELQRVVPARPSARLLAATSCYESGRNELAELLVPRRARCPALQRRRPHRPRRNAALREPVRRGRGRGRARARGLGGRRPGRRRPAIRARRLRRRRGDGRRAGRGRAVAGTPRRRVLPGLGRRAERPAAAGDPAHGRRADGGDRAGGAAPRAGHRGIRQGAAAVAAARPEPARPTESLAWIYFRRGFLDSAAEEWIAVASTQPDVPSLMGLSQVALARGMHQDAAVFAAEAVGARSAAPGGALHCRLLSKISIRKRPKVSGTEGRLRGQQHVDPRTDRRHPS